MVSTSEEVWAAFHARLLRFIRSHVADDASAEDILQDVFLKIHTRLDTLTDERKLTSWVYQIARNAIIDHARAQRPLAEMPDQFAIPDEPDDDLARELVPGLTAMLDALPTSDREAILLADLSGLSQQDLADRLGISLSGAKSRVQRARRRLKDAFVTCCQLEFDRRGRVIELRPGCVPCAQGHAHNAEDTGDGRREEPPRGRFLNREAPASAATQTGR
jgi:RNA polymerase sigma-70 factor, ECF subfamily